MARFLPSKGPSERGGSAAPLFVALVVLVGFLCVGCGNTCFVFVSNPGNGVIIVGGSTNSSGCLAPQPHGAVHVTAHLVPVCETCSPANRIRRMFLTLSGIELHSTSPGAQDDDWKIVQPATKQPSLRVELQPTRFAEADRVSLGPLADVPAGTYDLLKLRFAVDDSIAGVPSSETSPCGDAGPNCALMDDGRLVPLAIDVQAPGLLIPLAGGSSGPLPIVPDADIEIGVELVPLWSAVQSGRGLQLRLSVMGHIKIEESRTENNDLSPSSN